MTFTIGSLLTSLAFLGWVRNGILKLVKITGAESPADILTKRAGDEVVKGTLEIDGLLWESGRHSLSPDTARDEK